MSIVSQNMKAENSFNLSVANFFKKFSVGSILEESNAYKEKGIPCVQVFTVLFKLAFTGKNLFMNYETGNSELTFARDAAYRLLNSAHIQTVKKRRGRAKYLASVLVELHNKEGANIPAKIVFVRDRRNKSKWLALISTDVELPETEIIRIYGKRWNIEVFFKMCKSYLKLAKELQGRSYDMMAAHTTIVFSRYIMLAVKNRNNTDLRTIGALFYYCCDELEDIRFLDALQLITDVLKTALQEKLFLTKETMNEFLDYFVSTLPDYFKAKISISSCES